MELNEPFFAEQKRKNGAAGKKFLRYSLDGAVSNPVPQGTAYSRGSTTVLSPIFSPPPKSKSTVIVKILGRKNVPSFRFSPNCPSFVTSQNCSGGFPGTCQFLGVWVVGCGWLAEGS